MIKGFFQVYFSMIIAAEYLLRLLPRETHTFERFIRPSELARAVRAAGLNVVDTTGLAYQPFSRTSRLQEGLAVNYLLAAKKPEE